MNILLLDIETAPNAAYVWGLFKQNISPTQVIESSYVMCWSAKWLGVPKQHFARVKDGESDPRSMLLKIHTMLERADVVVHFNGTKFDIPVLNKEFLIHNIKPPSPYRQVDLYQLFKRKFRFESNRLDAIARRLDLGQKLKHEGFQLWIDCMAGDREAWKTMEAYNRQDVVILEKLYKRVLPWIDKHPNHGTYEDALVCTNCGGENHQRRGFAVTRVMKYARYQCNDCGAWFRGNKSVSLRATEKFVGVVS
jgi:DNA polymerase elongation subunit (family B)